MAIVSDAIAPQGSGGVVVAGVAGVGKTRLAREALARAQRQGRHCHWISATTSGRSVPLGAFSEFARDFGPDPLRRVQEVLDALIDGRPPMSTVVGVDDAHLLDEQSALVVHQLVQRGCATVVLTHRSGELAPDAISSLWKDERLPRMELQPLAAEEVGQLLEQALGGVVESLSTERLWRYTHGNVLYLRQLVGDETAGGRLYKRSGVWVWDGHPDFSPTLLELIESNIGRQTGPIIEVLDIVALADPVELPVLLHLTSSEAVDEAQQRGLIRVDDAAQVARLAHPMFGEVRRARAGPIRLRQLRGRLAHTIGQVCATSLHQTVRRAVLMLESDADHDPALLQEAAAAALQLLDMKLAVRLAHAATECGGGRAAELNYAFALANAAQGRRGEELLSRLAASATDAAERAQIALARAGNLAWNLCDAVAAERELDAAQVAADACGLTDTFNALRASCLAARGKPAAAVALADAALSAPGVAGFVRMLGMWGQVYGLADLGDLDQMSAAAAHAYAFARTTSDASHLRFGLGIAHIDGLRLAGELEDARAVATQLGRDARDVEASRQTTALMTGLCELAAGNLDAAQRHLRESAALASEFQDESPSILELSGVWLATALAMAGDVAGARRVLTDTPRLILEEFRYWDIHRPLAEAWVDAGDGVPTTAARTVTVAAERARSFGRPAREVLCLQTAAQFGDSSGADRLAELSSIVQGPRVGVASSHCAALCHGDGDGLLAASRAYEAFGDRVAAVDAAAQAAVVFRDRGRRGSSLTAAAMAQRLAAETGADTHALRASVTELPLTERQREIVTLAARGLSNREIAEQLVLSVRTVEGHLFQASLNAGVNTREELIALLHGRPAQFK